MIAVADKHENVYLDTSVYTARRYPAELVRYLRGRGRGKVLFGTTHPMITPVQARQRSPGVRSVGAANGPPAVTRNRERTVGGGRIEGPRAPRADGRQRWRPADADCATLLSARDRRLSRRAAEG